MDCRKLLFELSNLVTYCLSVDALYKLYVELDAIECILEGSKEPSILSHQLLLFITGIFSREQEIGRSEYAITYRVMFL